MRPLSLPVALSAGQLRALAVGLAATAVVVNSVTADLRKNERARFERQVERLYNDLARASGADLRGLLAGRVVDDASLRRHRPRNARTAGALSSAGRGLVRAGSDRRRGHARVQIEQRRDRRARLAAEAALGRDAEAR